MEYAGKGAKNKGCKFDVLVSVSQRKNQNQLLLQEGTFIGKQ